MDSWGAEELALGESESERDQTVNKEPASIFPNGTETSKPETKSTNNGNGPATQAQCRALYALTKRGNYSEKDIESMLRPFNASTFQDLTRESASQLISSLQTEVAA